MDHHRDRTRVPALSSRGAVVVAVACIALLGAVSGSWFLWPRSDPSADLVAGPARATTTVPAGADTTAPVIGTTPVTSAVAEAAADPPPASEPPPTTAPMPPAAPVRVPAPAPTPTPTRQAAAGEPTRLRIASIGVDTSVVGVGLQADGQMEVPPATLVGWYRLGPRPGAPGSSVLAAHIDYGGQRGAFFALPRVQVGDPIVVTDGAGIDRRYVVTERAQVPKAEVDLARYFTNAGPSRVTLITCGGAFNAAVGHYRDNIIITAVPA